MALGYTSSADFNGTLSTTTINWILHPAYTSSTDFDGTLSSNQTINYLVASVYNFTNDLELTSNLTVNHVPYVYISSADVFGFTSTAGAYTVNATYTSSVDDQSFASNLGGVYTAGATYTSSIDNQSFASNLNGLYVPFGYRDSLNVIETFVGTKNATYGYTDVTNLLSSDLTGLKNTKALPVYIEFNSAIPNVRLNIPNNVPFLKQVFVE